MRLQSAAVVVAPDGRIPTLELSSTSACPRAASVWTLPAVPRRLLLTTGSVLAGAALALLWTGATADPATANAGTCSVFWTGATDTSWTVPTNWAATAAGTGTGRVPLGTDMACMATAPARTTVEYFSYNRTVAGIDFGVNGTARPTLRVHGGVLTVGSAGGSFDSVINNLELLEGGVLRGTADHTLTGAPSLTDNAILEGGGTTTLVAGMNVATNGLVVSDGRRLVVEGQLTHDGCYDFVYLYNGGVLQNAGRLVAASDCGMQIYSDGTNGSKIVNDAGATIQVTQAAAATYHLTGPFENHGRVEIPNGSLIFRPLGSPDGSYHLGSNARLLVAPGGGLWIRPGTLSGGQTVVVTGGRVHVDPGVSVASIDVQSGLLTGNPTVTTLTAAPGATITGGGTVTVAPSGTATIDGLVIDGDADLRNLGTMTHVDCTAPIDLRKGATLINEGVWKLPCGSTVEGDGSSGVLVRNAAGGLIDGELPGTAQEYHFNTRTTNDGQVEMAKGRIEFANLTNLASGRLTGGNYVVTGGVLQVPGNIVTNAGTIRIVTPGDLVTPAGTRALLQLQTNSGSLNLNQLLTPQTQVTNTGTITVTANTFKPKSYRQTAGSTIVQSSATLAAADGPGAIDIDGGTLSGAGRVGSIDGAGTIRPAMTLTVNGQYNPTPSGILEIDISGPGNAGKLAVAGNATLNGTLRLVTTAGYTPARGATFTVVTMSFRSGTFTTVTGVNLPGGNYYAVTYGATSITITVKQLSQVTAADGQALVGPAGDTPMTFDVSLDEPSTQDVTVAYETVEETASAMLDFLPASGVLVFPPGVQ